MSTAQFTLGLVDGVSGPASRANKAMKELSWSMKTIKGSSLPKASEFWAAPKQIGFLENLKSQWGDVTDGIGPYAGALAGVASTAVSVATTTISALASMGAAAVLETSKLVFAGVQYANDLQQAKQATLFGLKTMLGTASAANAAYDDAARIATLLGGSQKEVAGGLRDLVGKGIDVETSKAVLQAMADIKSMNPGADLQKLTLAIGQIKGKGKVQMEELQGQIAEQFPIDKILKEYADILNVKGKTEADRMNTVRKMISDGKVDADVGIKGILKAVQTQGGGGPLGSVAQAFSDQTALGQIAKFKGQIETMFTSIDLSGLSSGFAGFVGQFTNQFTGFFNPKTMRGEAIMSVFSNIAGAAGNLLSALSGGGALKNMFTDAVFGAANFAAQLRNLTASKGFASGLQQVLSIIGQTFSVVGAGVTGFIRGLSTGFAALGTGGTVNMQQLAVVAGKVGQAIGTLLPQIIPIVSSFLSFGSTVAGVATASRSSILVVTQAIGLLSAAIAGPIGQFGAMGGMLAGAFDIFAQVFGELSFSDYLSGLVSEFASAGADATAGLASGIMSGIGAAIAAVQGLAELLPASVKSILGIASPSKVFAGLGKYSAEGLAVGLDQGQRDVATSATNLGKVSMTAASFGQSQEPGQSQGGKSKSGGGGPITLNFSISGGNADEIALAVRREVAALFTEMGYS